MLQWSLDTSAFPLAGLSKLQAKDDSRSTLIPCLRTDANALKLTTRPGDDHVINSGDMRRCDYYKVIAGTQAPDVYYTGSAPQWWGVSTMFPVDEWTRPSWYPYNFLDFHNYPENIGGSANVALNFVKNPRGDMLPGLMRVQRLTGSIGPDGKITNVVDHSVVVGDGDPRPGLWHDWLFHVKWSDKGGADGGFLEVWHNGDKIVEHLGKPTLFPKCGVYLKLANYHLPTPLIEQAAPYNVPATPACSVIFDRVRMGTTRASVE